MILDNVGNRSFSECRRVLNPEGTHIIVGGPSGRWMIGSLARALASLVLSRFVSQNLVVFLAKSNKEDLAIIRTLIESGQVTPVIDHCYSLSEVPEAIRYLETGHARGKVVVTVGG